MTALEVRQLSAGYGPVRVLHEIDLQVALGERVGLLGLNGHGKTTLMRAIVGLVGWRRGEIEVHGRSMMKSPTHRFARAGVVMIPQGDALFPGLTVRENLDAGAFPARAWKVRRKRRDMVLDLFPRLGERLAQPVGTLSGGERRMVSIGRGLMTDADVYLIDEPSLGLAPGIISALMDSLFAVGVEGGSDDHRRAEPDTDRGPGRQAGAHARRPDRQGRSRRPRPGHGGRGMTDVIVTTLNLAAIYGLVAVGISITWAGLGFLNLAQGTTFAIAGYGAWWADAHLVEQPVVILAGIVTGAMCGVIICIAVFLPLYGKRNWRSGR